jgi:hypothetical protein
VVQETSASPETGTQQGVNRRINRTPGYGMISYPSPSDTDVSDADLPTGNRKRSARRSFQFPSVCPPKLRLWPVQQPKKQRPHPSPTTPNHRDGDRAVLFWGAPFIAEKEALRQKAPGIRPSRAGPFGPGLCSSEDLEPCILMFCT